MAGLTRFDGESSSDSAGEAVGRAANINGDGLADILIGVPDHASDVGAAYIVFGASSFGSTLILGTTGFELRGGGSGSYGAGKSLDASGDVNGDRLADIIVGLPYGAFATVVFGATTFASSSNLASLENGTSGFKLNGNSDDAGRSVSIAGDLNGDGFEDVIVGVRYADPIATNEGSAFVVFGASSFTSTVTLNAVNGVNGFRLDGVPTSDALGDAVARIGDFNGDGFDDIVAGARLTDIGSASSVGTAYVLFGASNVGTGGTLSAGALNGANGFKIDGLPTTGGQFGGVAGYAGDVNGDGYDDLIVGSGYNGEGVSAAIFGGSAVASNGAFDLTTLNGANGFLIPQRDDRDYGGSDVSGAGDINGDGFDDLIIGARRGDGSAASSSDDRGESYIIFGGDFSNAINFLGTANADGLTGGTGAEVFVAGLGNDVIVGGGGADVIKGGGGDDVFSVGDLNFRRIEGDAGTDTLQFSLSNTTIDLTSIANNRISGLEKTRPHRPGQQQQHAQSGVAGHPDDFRYLQYLDRHGTNRRYSDGDPDRGDRNPKSWAQRDPICSGSGNAARRERHHPEHHRLVSANLSWRSNSARTCSPVTPSNAIVSPFNVASDGP